jgi:hypothetical protein
MPNQPDRYSLAREFNLQAFEMQIMQCTDLYAVQETCVKLYAQTLMQRKVYEDLLRDLNKLPPLPRAEQG